MDHFDEPVKRLNVGLLSAYLRAFENLAEYPGGPVLKLLQLGECTARKIPCQRVMNLPRAKSEPPKLLRRLATSLDVFGVCGHVIHGVLMLVDGAIPARVHEAGSSRI